MLAPFGAQVQVLVEASHAHEQQASGTGAVAPMARQVHLPVVEFIWPVQQLTSPTGLASAPPVRQPHRLMPAEGRSRRQL